MISQYHIQYWNPDYDWNLMKKPKHPYEFSTVMETLPTIQFDHTFSILTRQCNDSKFFSSGPGDVSLNI